MARYYCHEYPDVLVLETRVVDARPSAVLLDQSPFHPGGGGQLADRGLMRWNGGEVRVSGIEAVGGRYWHLLAEPVEMAGTVEAVVDADFRSIMAQLHTDTHILNALVFRQFQGALVTGAQLNEDGTARMDFDLPEADNDRLRAVAPPPTEDGTIRVVEIVGLDRQACGGTHLASTAGSRPLRILKIDNKGRHNRRIKIGLAGESPR